MNLSIPHDVRTTMSDVPEDHIRDIIFQILGKVELMGLVGDGCVIADCSKAIKVVGDRQTSYENIRRLMYLFQIKYFEDYRGVLIPSKANFTMSTDNIIVSYCDHWNCIRHVEPQRSQVKKFKEVHYRQSTINKRSRYSQSNTHIPLSVKSQYIKFPTEGLSRIEAKGHLFMDDVIGAALIAGYDNPSLLWSDYLRTEKLPKSNLNIVSEHDKARARISKAMKLFNDSIPAIKRPRCRETEMVERIKSIVRAVHEGQTQYINGADYKTKQLINDWQIWTQAEFDELYNLYIQVPSGRVFEADIIAKLNIQPKTCTTP